MLVIADTQKLKLSFPDENMLVDSRKSVPSFALFLQRLLSCTCPVPFFRFISLDIRTMGLL